MSFLKNVLRLADSLLHGLELWWCVFGLLACTGLVFVQVVNRWLLKFPAMGIGDIALYVFIAFMLVAAAYTTWNEGHVAVDVVVEKLTRTRPRTAVVHKLALSVIMLGAAITIVPVSCRFMLAAIHYPQYGTLVRWFNTSWLQILFFVTLVFILVHLTVIVLRNIAGVLIERHDGKER